MFLTRVEIPWELVRNPYDLHRQIWKLFPGKKTEVRKFDHEPRQNFLFKIEKNFPGHAVRLLVQSRESPSAAPMLSLLGTKEFYPKLIEGEQLAFSLTANPIKTIRDIEKSSKQNKSSDKCRVPLLREEEQREWLARKFKEVAIIESVDIYPQSPLYFRKGHQAGKIKTVLFEGQLRVLSPSMLIALLENGIGPAKGFGCGLMLVRRT